MKKIIVWLCFLALVLASCATTQGGGTAVRGARGQIPLETRVRVLFANGSLDEYTVSEYDDSLSFLQRQIRYSASGAQLELVEFTYQESDGLLGSRVTRDRENRLHSQVVYQYNDQGKLWLETQLNRDGVTVSSYEYSYDSRGHQTGRILSIGATLIKMGETIYTVNNNGLILSWETYDGTGRKISSAQNEYSGSNLIRQTAFDADGQITAVTNFVWQGGNQISSEQTGPDGSVQLRITNEYGQSGELFRRTIANIQGNSIQVMEYEYTFRPARR